MYAEINNQCPDESQPEENCVLSVKWNKKIIRVSVYLMLKGSLKSYKTICHQPLCLDVEDIHLVIICPSI